MKKNINFFVSLTLGILSSIFASFLIFAFQKFFNVFKNAYISVNCFIALSILSLLFLFIICFGMKYYKQYPILSQEIDGILQTEKELEEALAKDFLDAKSIKVLDMRGYLYTQQNRKLFRCIVGLEIPIQFLFLDPFSEAVKFREKNTPYKKEGTLSVEILTSIENLSNLSKKNFTIKTFKEHIIFRLIFIDSSFLYLTPFRNGKFISDAPTYKLKYGSSLYECFENYYLEVWNNKSKNI